MDMLHSAGSALLIILDPIRMAYLFGGVCMGLALGILPGIGGVAGLALLLPFTYNIDPPAAFALLLGMGSTTTTAHDIEEAVLMCDRILVFSSNPGRIVSDIKVPFPQPRNRLDPKFRQLVDDIYSLMTSRPVGKPTREGMFPGTGIAMVLPRVSPNVLSGLTEAVAAEPYNGRADLPALAASLQMEIDDLFPVADTLQLLRFAEVAEGDIRLTEAGRRFVQSDLDQRKRLFAQHLLTYVPLAGHIKRVLDERASHRAPASRFRDELEDSMSEEAAEKTLRAIISWARYGEAFAYDEDSGVFSLENPS